MTNSLVTLPEVKGSLRYTDSDNDVRLSLLIEAASNSILRYLKSTGDEYRDTNGIVVPGNVPGEIKLATITLIAIYDHNADNNEGNIFEANQLPAPVESILHSMREPTVA